MMWEILKAFSVKNKTSFRYQDVLEEFPGKDRSYLSRMLSSMVSKGMLMKLYRDSYHIIPLNADPVTYSPDSRIVAKYLLKETGYYIAYSSAMYIHGLAEQAGDSTIVATERQRQPSKLNLGGADYHFVYHSARRFFGFEDMWVNNQEQVLVSDLEKTIVDAMSKPQLCGGIMALGKAMLRSEKGIEHPKLFYYLARNFSFAAKKRYLFLVDLLDLKWTSEHDRMLESSGTSISLLDPAGPDRGIRNAKFGLKVNTEVDAIKKLW